MRKPIEKDEVKKNFAFHYDDERNSVDLFFCKCGHTIVKDRKEVASEMKISIRDGSNISDFTNLFDENSSARFNLKCEKCDFDYSEKDSAGLVQECDKKFFESYCFTEEENDVKLIKQRFSGVVNMISKPVYLIHDSIEPTLEISESLSWIRFSKNEKKLFFKDFNKDEIEFNLDKIMLIVKSFFLPGEAKVTERLFDVHLFVDRMANFVSDSKNINIIDELMSQMIGKSGLDIITKVTSIFFGIICYPNLSTIALTKGTVFLFDMMNDCKLPNLQEFSDNNATSPLKIFNYLVNYKNEELSKELDSDDSEKVGYVFKSQSGKETILKYDANRFEKNRQTTSDSKSGEIFLREDISKKSVSPFIFNSIERFSDYKILIKYTKFISYENLIDIVKKNNINLLIHVLPLVEYRADMDINKINQIFSLCISFLKRSNKLLSGKFSEGELEFARTKFLLNEIEKEVEVKVETPAEEIKLDYFNLISFNFTHYDDSLRMIRALNWDPAKEFYKIKKIDELEDYHNKLSEHFNLLANDAKNKDFVSFVMKYNVLEEYDENKLKVRLIRTPELLLKASQDMRNCASSYVNRISNCQYVLCLIEDIDENRAKTEPLIYMLGLKANVYGELEFDQVKAACNMQGPDRFKTNVMEFLQEKEISYKELSDLKLSTNRVVCKADLNDLIERLGNVTGLAEI
jgi:hypothetical protein